MTTNLSELIRQLQSLKEQEGDLEVIAYGSRGYYSGPQAYVIDYNGKKVVVE
jgi:hypothetical protein